MYLLNDTPILLEFLKRFFKFANIEFRNKHIHKKFYIYSKCVCSSKECATVTLKSRTPWKDRLEGSYIYNTNKGVIIIHILEKGFLEIEALCYENYPYKNEIDKFIKTPRVIHDSIPRQKKNTKKLSRKDKQKIHKYFWNLKKEKLNTINIDIDE